ncbi:DNA-binding transcriptional LysR family regulator [Jejuia pallidilutea]|uniref:DNA-binding transcriptional LysR family regulator n=1 Tax=Jejuia pallidilutea TaxID=504487 RepID=A0A362X2K6_9FLAO|nr:LysR substrate-binding domain-containing protein [Jejuia pallidilutea]PQV48366.1 DNA-binding transcriptional LysR family regulator [Jejuia pallidilutea]
MSNQLELRHLKYFLAVAEELHFRRAAERLFISQPGLSRQIKQMEEDLGVTLFERHNRKVVLTKAGVYLKAELSRNLQQLEDIINHAKLINEGKKGQLKLGYVGSAMQELIPKLLLKYKTRKPNVVFNLKEIDNQKQIEGLLNFKIDVGFVRLEHVPSIIETQVVLSDTFCLVLPEHHNIDASNFKSLSQLKDSSFILFDPEYSASYYDKVLQIFKDHAFTPIVSHLTIHASSIYKLVENNFGISLVPKSLTTNSVRGVKFIELDKIPQRTELFMVWHKENRNPILMSFLDIIKKQNP